MPLSRAYGFAATSGLQVEADRIRLETPLGPGFQRGKQVRKALLLELFEAHNLLAPFYSACWPFGATEWGRAKRESYNQDREANERLLKIESSITDEQRERIIALLKDGELGRDDIAANVGVAPGTVSAIKAHMTMGAYGEKETEEAIEASEVTFGLERDLQTALRANIEQLESGLEVVDGGKERQTDAGRLDITARDGSGAIVVIELKAGVAAPEALTQLLAYMGAIAQEEQKPVRGVLIAGGYHPRITFAARAVPNVQLRQYRFKFTFEAVE